MTSESSQLLPEVFGLLGGALAIITLSYAASRVLRSFKHGFSVRLQLFFALFFASICTTTLIGFWAIRRIEARAAQLFEESGLSAEVFQEFIRDFGPKVSLILGVLTLIAAGSAWALGRGLAQPIERLSRAAEEISKGGSRGQLPEPIGREVRHLTDAFIAMHQALEDRQRFERFIADLSHDLKNPVAAIRASSEVLLSGAGDDPIARNRFLVRIDEASQRLDRLLSDFLSLARLEARGMKSDPTPLNLLELTVYAVQSFEASAEVKGVQFSLIVGSKYIPEDDWMVELKHSPQWARFFMSGSRLWITRALENLVSNALRYTPTNGSIRLSWRIETARKEQEHKEQEHKEQDHKKQDHKEQDHKEQDHKEQDHKSQSFALLRVEDQGVGVDPTLRDTLFERFITDYQNPAGKTGGSGLGLAIVKRVAEAHGGGIQLIDSHSKPSTLNLVEVAYHGACFELWIKL